VVSASNPKALIFFATFLPQFVRPADPLMPQFVILAATVTVMQLVYEVAIAMTARRLGG
jgi:homoserine/homoserine lactone efflux protein